MKLSLDFYVLPFNPRIRFKTQFHAIVSLVRLRRLFQTTNKQDRAQRKLLHVKISSGATYAVRRRRTRPRAIPLALTKIFRIVRLPFFLTHGALRARARRARAERRYNRNPFLNGFNKARYLSTANTLKVIEETVTQISVRTLKSLQKNSPDPKKYVGANKIVMTSLTAMFANR